MDKMPVPIFKEVMKDRFIDLIRDYHKVQDEEYEKLRLVEVGCETREEFENMAKNPLGE